MMKDTDLIQALRRMVPETGSLPCLGCGYEHKCSTRGCTIIKQAVERLERLTTPPANDPLTLEQLREMGNDWVWIKLLAPQFYRMESGYFMKREKFSSKDILCCGYPGVVVMSFSYSGYGSNWLAYRRRPEEGTQ